MVQAIITITRQTGIDEWHTYYHSKTFEKSATLKEIEDWATSYDGKVTLFDVKLATKD